MSLNRWFIFGAVAAQPTRYGTILIDVDDLPAVSKLLWHVRAGKHHIYVRAWLDSRRASPMRGERVYLHNLLMNPDKGYEVDFHNGNTLDCRRPNMRIADRTENNCNRRVTHSSSGFLGVHFDKSRGKWLAQIKFRGDHKFIGRFDDLMDAVAARDRVASEIHGEFASTLNAELLAAG